MDMYFDVPSADQRNVSVKCRFSRMHDCKFRKSGT